MATGYKMGYVLSFFLREKGWVVWCILKADTLEEAEKKAVLYINNMPQKTLSLLGRHDVSEVEIVS